MDKLKQQINSLTPEQRRKVIAAAEIVDKGDLAVLKNIIEFKDIIEENTAKVEEGLQKVDNIAEKVDNAVLVSQETLEEIRKEVSDVLAEVKDGETPTDEHLLALIKPLIPKPKEGKTPSVKELLDIIEPLIPEIDAETIASLAVEKIKLPEYKQEILNGEDIIDKINETPLTDENKIEFARIKNVPVFKGRGGHSPTVIGNAVDLDQSARADGYAVVWDNTNARFKFAASGGGGGSPGGSDTQVQFNDGGSFGGDAGFTYNKTTDTVTLAGGVVIGSSNPFSDSAGTLTLQNVDVLDATTEATIEGAIDTLANLTSIQGRTITLADAGTNAIFGWDDVAGAYENLTAAEATAVLNNFVGDSGSGGTKGLVPAPSAGDATKFLKGDGTWAAASGGGGITRTIVTTSASLTLGSTSMTDYVYLVAGAHTLSMPTAVGNTNRYTVKNNHTAAITIDTAGAENIEGAASISLAPEDSVDIISDNTNWWII